MVTAQRMLPGQKGLEIHAGGLSADKPGRNYYLNIGLTINTKNGNYRLLAFEFTHSHLTYKRRLLPLETYTIAYGYSFYLFGDAARNISLNAGLTGVLGYENINSGENMLPDGARLLEESSVIYGAGGRLSLETYLCDRLVLLLQGRVKVLWGTDGKQLRPAAGVGLRFNF